MPLTKEQLNKVKEKAIIDFIRRENQYNRYKAYETLNKKNGCDIHPPDYYIYWKEDSILQLKLLTLFSPKIYEIREEKEISKHSGNVKTTYRLNVYETYKDNKKMSRMLLRSLEARSYRELANIIHSQFWEKNINENIQTFISSSITSKKKYKILELIEINKIFRGYYKYNG